MKCKVCGSDVKDGRCPVCGTSAPAPEQSPQKPKHGGKTK